MGPLLVIVLLEVDDAVNDEDVKVIVPDAESVVSDEDCIWVDADDSSFKSFPDLRVTAPFDESKCILPSETTVEVALEDNRIDDLESSEIAPTALISALPAAASEISP